MRKIIGALLIVAALGACTDPRGATRALEGLDLRGIELTGFRLWGCGQDDQYATGFRAKNAKGQVVTGVVCGGWLKGSTVRFD